MISKWVPDELLPGTVLFDQVVRLWLSASSLDQEVSPVRC